MILTLLLMITEPLEILAKVLFPVKMKPPIAPPADTVRFCTIALEAM